MSQCKSCGAFIVHLPHCEIAPNKPVKVEECECADGCCDAQPGRRCWRSGFVVPEVDSERVDG